MPTRNSAISATVSTGVSDRHLEAIAWAATASRGRVNAAPMWRYRLARAASSPLNQRPRPADASKAMAAAKSTSERREPPAGVGQRPDPTGRPGQDHASHQHRHEEHPNHREVADRLEGGDLGGANPVQQLAGTGAPEDRAALRVGHQGPHPEECGERCHVEGGHPPPAAQQHRESHGAEHGDAETRGHEGQGAEADAERVAPVRSRPGDRPAAGGRGRRPASPPS